MKSQIRVIAWLIGVILLIALSGCSSDDGPSAPQQSVKDDVWVRTTGPGGGRVGAFTTIGTDLFVSLKEAGGVFRSTDNGVTWSPAGLADKSVASLAARGGTLFAGTINSDILPELGVFRSTDNGANWTMVGLGGNGIGALAADETNVYAGTWGSGVFHSTDDGETWTAATTTLGSNVIHTLAISENGLFAGTGGFSGQVGNIYRSTDDGVAWTKVHTTPMDGNNGVGVRAIVASGSTLFAGLGNGEGVLRSTNGGTSWSAFNSAELADRWIYALAANETFLFAGTDEGVYRSSKGTANWTQTDWISGYAEALTFSGPVLFVGTSDYGVYRSNDDGGSWTDSNQGLAGTFSRLLMAAGSALFSDTGLGLFRTTDQGATWAEVSGLEWLNSGVKALAESGTRLFAGTYNGIYRSSDGGASWTRNPTQTPNSEINSFAVDGTSLFVGTNNGVYRTTDNGVTWTATASQPANTIQELVISNTDLFARTPDGVFRSTDDGATWTAVNAGLLGSYYDVSRLVATGTNLFASKRDDSSNARLYRLDGDGATWTVIDAPFTTLYGFGASETSLFVGTWWDGIFRSDDGGDSWTTMNTGLGKLPILEFAVSGTNLFGASFYAGVWRFPI